MVNDEHTFVDHLAIAPQLERRAFQRQPCWMQADCSLTTARKGQCWPATVCDLSPGGVGMLLQHRLEPGTIVGLKLTDLSGALTFYPMARVRYVQTHDGEHWFLGCAFAQALTDEQLELLL